MDAMVTQFPGSTISPQETPALAKAAPNAIGRRLQRPDWEDVEWSRANAINYYATGNKEIFNAYTE